MSLRNRKLIGWKIWYDTGIVLDSRYWTWEEAKQDGVQVVALFYSSDNGIERNLHYNQEYYLLDDLLELPKSIKTARGINGDKFYSILEKAKNDKSEITFMRTDDSSSSIGKKY